MAKFSVKVDGKDSIENALSAAVAARLEAGGMTQADPKWETKYDALEAKLQKKILKFVEDGEGGNDAVTLEFDDDPAIDHVRVVPVKEAKAAERACEKAKEKAAKEKQRAADKAQKELARAQKIADAKDDHVGGPVSTGSPTWGGQV